MTEAAIFCNQCGTQNAPTVQFCGRCGTPMGAAAQSTAGAHGYAAPGTQVPVAAHYGGFWIRFVAVLIDGILVQMVVFPVVLFFGVLSRIAEAGVHMSGVFFLPGFFGIRFVFGALVSWLYEAAMESSAQQATLGKMVVGLKVIDLQGNRISFARATGRHFAKIVSAMTLLIGYIMAGFTERKQALHDMIAGTLVRYR